LGDGHGEFTLDYDPCGRVREAVASDGRAQKFDRATGGAVLHEPADRRTGPTRTAHGAGLVCIYDAVGQLTRRQSAAGEATFHWDGLGRLAEVTTERGQAIRYGYDALGRRVFKEVDGRRVRFRWYGEQLLADEPDGGPPREFVCWPGSFVPLAVVAGQDLICYQTGPAGIPQALGDATGPVVLAAGPDALAGVGRVTVADTDNPLRLQGQYFDAETGLCYNRHRYFDPAVGQFVSADPLGLGAGPDLYGYAPNVFGWIDPLGLARKGC